MRVKERLSAASGCGSGGRPDVGEPIRRLISRVSRSLRAFHRRNRRKTQWARDLRERGSLWIERPESSEFRNGTHFGAGGTRFASSQFPRCGRGRGATASSARAGYRHRTEPSAEGAPATGRPSASCPMHSPAVFPAVVSSRGRSRRPGTRAEGPVTSPRSARPFSRPQAAGWNRWPSGGRADADGDDGVVRDRALLGELQQPERPSWREGRRWHAAGLVHPEIRTERRLSALGHRGRRRTAPHVQTLRRHVLLDFPI